MSRILLPQLEWWTTLDCSSVPWLFFACHLTPCRHCWTLRLQGAPAFLQATDHLEHLSGFQVTHRTLVSRPRLSVFQGVMHNCKIWMLVLKPTSLLHVCFPASWLRCLLPWVMVWVLSGVGAVWGCVRVLYLWEPITPLHSPKSVSFWRHRKQADLHLNRVSAQHFFISLRCV